MQISDEQLTVFTGLQNIKLKIYIVYVYLGILIALTIVLILLMTCIASDWPSKAITGAVDGLLIYTIRPMSNHFFPAAGGTKKTPVKKATQSAP